MTNEIMAIINFFKFISGTDACSWVPKTLEARKKLLLQILTQEVEISPLGSGNKYVENTVLASDIRDCLYSESGGVKIFWAPPGTGKTTTIRHVLNAEFEKDKISGVLILSPPRMTCEPDEWFRSKLNYGEHETLKQNDDLSSMINAPPDKPYVIVIDQCDNFNFDEKMRLFIKSIAEDSHRTKKYIIMVLCSDAQKASTMNEWNGGVKIKVVRHDYKAYKWSNTQIDRWIENNIANHERINNRNESHFNKFKEAALIAGTPDFLIINSLSKEHKSLKDIEHSWIRNAEYLNKIWDSGEMAFSVNDN